MAYLRPMTAAECERYNLTLWEDDDQERARNLGISVAHERAIVAGQRESLQAEGMRAPGHHYWRVTDDAGAGIGSLWVFVEPGTDCAFIYEQFGSVDILQEAKGTSARRMR